MPPVHLVRLAQCPPQPWRNGGGRTRELLAWPVSGADASPPIDWQVRVSVATIAADGPFSAFPGVDRWFTVLTGAGVTLDLPSGPASRVPDDAPLAFPGEAAPGCRLRDGPTDDLNLMVRRRGGGTAGVGATRGAAGDGDPAADAAPGTPLAWRAVFTMVAGAVAVDDDAPPYALLPGDLLWSDAAAPTSWRWCGDPAARAWWLSPAGMVRVGDAPAAPAAVPDAAADAFAASVPEGSAC